jgi:hypothetical protein
MTMKRLHTIAICLSLAGAIASGSAFAQPVAQQPAFVVGDSWEYKSVTTPGDKPGTWSRTIIAAPSDQEFKVRFQDNTVNSFDKTMNFMPEGNPSYARILARYPMKVGDGWEMSRRYADPRAVESGEAKVVAYEQITVPAGTFQCFRVEAKATLNNKSFAEASKWTRWYCPEVKHFAKESFEQTVTGSMTSGRNGTTLVASELVKFTPGK